MKNIIWIGGEVQGDIGEPCRLAGNEVEGALNGVLNGQAFGSGFASLNLIPIILNFEDPTYKEVRRYHKKRQDFEFRLKIPHAVFKAASPLGQRRLVVQNILRAVAEMRKMRVKDVDCDKLEQAIREVAAAHDWLGDPPTLH